jgi:carboxyl-terminal processing protease
MKKIWLVFPLLLALALAVGIYVGADLASVKTGGTLFQRPYDQSVSKLSQIINFIESQYVDTVDKAILIDQSIQDLLQNLDPHSYYISAKEIREHTEPLEGNFDGIGVEFTIQSDTVFVVTPLIGGPSESLGILSGDRIVAVDGENIAGIGITNRDVMTKLRGQRGTIVKVKIKRKNVSGLLDFSITRGIIPIYSVAVSHMLDEQTGYIKVTRFARTTYDEFMEGVEKLNTMGMRRLVIDLRGNGGGYLNTAIAMCEELLPKGNLIVYTQGKAQPKKTYVANGPGTLSAMPLVVLIDQGSASASEIIAGALQDNDRCNIVGRRSFGKGLVQEHYDFPDSSAIRLTVARYYTPTGRSIQRPYGKGIDYEGDFYERYENGEMYQDTEPKQTDTLKYYTPKGKVVYGGGGISPDVFVPIDTSGASAYLAALSYQGVLNDFAFEYSDSNRDRLNAMGNINNFIRQFQVDAKILESLYSFAQNKGIERDQKGIIASSKAIQIRLKALIARNVWGNDAYYPIVLKEDTGIEAALKAF